MARNSQIESGAVAQYERSESFAQRMDEQDPLKDLRSHFHVPPHEAGQQQIYLAGNSLGLQPIKAKQYIEHELEDWARLAVEGHFHARHPWLPYHEFVTEPSARLVGAKEHEVVVMNTLTVNLHLMLVSFYRPTKTKYKILLEANAFPSDQYAAASQTQFHGFSPDDAIIEAKPRDGEHTIRTEDILELLNKHGDSIALVLLGDANYLTGQAFEIEKLAAAAHAHECTFGLNLAHGAGNLLLKLHDWNVDFAVWCSYKYLNAGPGGIAGCFVHERFSNSFDLPRFTGWWGHNKETRFKMGPTFDPIAGAEGWQLSNPPIFQLAALRASLELFDLATMPKLRQKSRLLTGYLEYLLNEELGDAGEIITPRDPEQRGSQLSIKFGKYAKPMLKAFQANGVICDFREPDIVRATPAPLYSRFIDVYRFVHILRNCIDEVQK
ncbi:MAG TPA: kynureninase [Planktothrix sp.]